MTPPADRAAVAASDASAEPGANGHGLPSPVHPVLPDAGTIAAARCQRLEDELAACSADLAADVFVGADRLRSLERETLELAAIAGELEPDTRLDPFQSALVAARLWRQFCEHQQLGEATIGCQQVQDNFAARTWQAWQTTTDAVLAAPTADACFHHLVHNTQLAGELVTPRGAGLDSVALLTEVRKELREAMLRCIAQEPPSDALRDRWANELVDRSEEVLTSVHDLPPDLATAQLELVADDLRWHIRHVERRAGKRRFKLRRKIRRLLAEAQDRQLQARLESRFGRRQVRRFERLVLALIVFVLGILFVEAVFDLSPLAVFWINMADTAACLVFLTEFCVKWWLSNGRTRWFWRHFLIDLVPAIPIGMVVANLPAHAAFDAVRLVLRALRPVVRLARGLGFISRGMDQVARRFGPILNRNVILYPTRAERRRARGESQSLARRVQRLHAGIGQQWRRLVLSADEPQRDPLASRRLDVLGHVAETAEPRHAMSVMSAPRLGREIVAEMLLRRLGNMSSQEVQARLGDDLCRRIARFVRICCRRPICWLPIVRSTVPRINARMNDAEVTAAGARRLAATLDAWHDRWFWTADLHGTVTPSEFVDRVGTVLVKSSFRPAYKLLLFGGFYLLVIVVVKIAPFEFLNPVEAFLKKFVGSALAFLGGICLVILGFGWWLKRLAREATEFYEQAAQAQFLSLTEIIRSRHVQRDARILFHRVLRPEWEQQLRCIAGNDGEGNRVTGDNQQVERFCERVRTSLLGNGPGDAADSFDMLERVVLLYRDSLDGALFVDNDNRTTCQLLGNPAVRQLLALSQRLSRKDVRRLRFLDLERQKTLFGGPYLWFNFISRAIAHATASLIVDYNRHAIPTDELPLVGEAKRQRYEAWLSAVRIAGSKALQFPAEQQNDRGAPHNGPQTYGQTPEARARLSDETTYVTTAFTALHFLDFDPQRDQEIEDRFGPAVRERMCRDRSLLIRRVFGTYPWQLEPNERRVLNLYTLYDTWLAEGRVFLLPLYLVWMGAASLVRLARFVVRAVREIRRPELRVDRTAEVDADFATAVRKLRRMRGPVVEACLRLRTMLDPEYSGVPLPGGERTGLEGADVQSDLKFLDAEPWLVERVEHERRRAEADMRRLGRLIEGGLIERIAARLRLDPAALATPQHRRAAAVAYLADFRGVRRRLSALEIIEEVFRGESPEQPPPPALRPRPGLRRLFHRYWLARDNSAYLDCRFCWQCVVHNIWGVADALCAWHRFGDKAAAEGEQILAEVLRHPGRITEQLVTLRTVQTLSILDVLNYRQHILQLGDYASAGDVPSELLNWETFGSPA